MFIQPSSDSPVFWCEERDDFSVYSG